MKGRDQLRTAVIEDLPPYAGDRLVGVQEGADGEGPESYHNLGLNHVDLAKQKGLAGLNLVQFRIPVVRRPAFDDVGDCLLYTSPSPRDRG